MAVRRAWRQQPVDECSWTVLTKHLGPESPDDDRGAPDPVYRRVQRESVNPLTKECLFKQSPWRVEETRVVQHCFGTESAAATSQHSGTSTRSAESPTRRSSLCESQRWRTRLGQSLHVGSLDRRSAQQNSSATVNGIQLEHREHDDSQRRGQQDCDSVEQPSSS